MFSVLILLLITLAGTAFFLLAPGTYWLLGAVILLATWFGYLMLIFPRKPVTSRGLWAFTGWFMLAAVIIATAIVGGMQLNELTLNIQGEGISTMSYFKERLFAVVLGGVLGFGLTVVFFIMVGYFSSIFVLAFQEEPMTFSTAFKSFVFLIFNFSLPWLVVENGKKVEIKQMGFNNAWLSRGKIIVKPGNVIVTERGGAITGIHGPGTIFTRKSERIREIIDLRAQFVTALVENLITADQIPIISIEIGIGYKITPATDPNSKTVLKEKNYGVYPVEEETIKKATFNTVGGKHIGFSEGSPGVMLRDQIMAHSIDQLFTLTQTDDSTPQVNRRRIQQIEQDIVNGLNSFADNVFGVTFTGVDIRQINLHPDYKEAIRTRLKAIAESEAIAAIEHRRNVARGELVTRILDAIATGTGNKIGQTELELATIFAQISRRALTDDVLGHQYIEMLRGMSTGDATKIFNVTPEPIHIEPGHLPDNHKGRTNGHGHENGASH